MADGTSTSDQHDCSGDPACNVKNQQYHFYHLQLLWPRCAAPTFLHFLLVSCQHALIQVLVWCFVSLTRIFIETLVNLNTHSEILPPFVHLVRLALPCQAIPTRHCSPQHVRTSEFSPPFLSISPLNSGESYRLVALCSCRCSSRHFPHRAPAQLGWLLQ